MGATRGNEFAANHLTETAVVSRILEADRGSIQKPMNDFNFKYWDSAVVD